MVKPIAKPKVIPVWQPTKVTYPTIKKPIVPVVVKVPEVLKSESSGAVWWVLIILLILTAATIGYFYHRRLFCFKKSPCEEKPKSVNAVELTSNSDDDFTFSSRKLPVATSPDFGPHTPVVYKRTITLKLWKLMVAVHTGLAVLCLVYTIIWSMDRSLNYLTWHVVEVPSKISADIRAMGEALDRQD